MTTLENINPTIGLNAEVHNSQNADILNNVTHVTPKIETPLDEKTLSKLSKLSNDPQALEPQDLAARQLDKTLSNDCLMLSNLSSKNEQNSENAQNLDEKCYTCYTEVDKKQPNVTQKNDDVTRRVTLYEKQPIDLKADFAKLSRVNKIAWYAQQGFDVLLGFRGRKGAGTGWNVPSRKRMTPEEATAKAQTAQRQTNTVLLCGARSTPFNSVGLLVVDVDIKNARTDQERNECHQALENLLGSEIYHQATVTSASGGLHYYIAVPPHQAHLIPKTKKISLASGEEYTRPSVNGNGGKVKAWELELLCNCLVQAIPSTVDGKEYTLNTGIIQQEIPPLVVELIEEHLQPKDEPEAEKPPLLKVVPVGKIGKNTIEIKQRDPNAIGVNLYRKIIRNNKSQNDAEYTFVGKIPLTINDGYKTIDDLVSNANTIIYRAIPYGQNNKLSFEFESAVTKPVKIPINLSSFHRKPNFSTMTYETLDSGIVIKFSNIPIGPVSLVLMKKDLTSNQKAIYVDIPKILNKKGSEEIVFKDTNVTKNRIYRYFYKYIYINGQEQFGSNDLTIEYKPETSNVVNTIILNPRVVQQGINLDVQFSLESNFIEKSENALLNALRIQGLNEFFNESINKDNLQDLIGYGIVRINLTNGDIEDFGINTQKNFSDFKFGNTKGVKPIKSGNEYQYIVSTYFRSAITMLEKYEKFEEFSNSSNFNYSFKPFEWLHPITLKKGNLVSKRSLVKNHAQSQFSFGEIGNITTTTVSIASILPSIYSIDASKVNSKLIKIQWKIQGEVSKIDHFIILVDILGMRSTVGKCHNISDSNYFEFLDELTNGESGALTYIVIPVYYDYSRGKEMQTNKVLV
jgi:hypothetical protein